MAWELHTAKGRDGAFRNLLQTVHQHVEGRAQEFVEHGTVAVGFTAEQKQPDAKAALIDVLYLMVQEHAQYRHNLRKQFGDYYETRNQSDAMALDCREQSAERLAAVRAEARLVGQPLPESWGEINENWMNIEQRR